MDNANLENLVALGYNLDGLTSKEIDRINQALAASSMDLGQLTDLVDTVLKGWEAFCKCFK